MHAYLDQVATQPTRITKTTANVLEVFFTSNPTLIHKVETIPGIADHEAVFTESSLRPMRVKTPPRNVYQYRKANYVSMQNELRAYQQEFEERATREDVECLWSTFKKKLNSIMDKYIPSKMIRGNKTQKPWVSKKVKSLRREQKMLFKRQRKTGAPRDVRQYRETKTRLQKAERQSYCKYIETLMEVVEPGQDYQPNQKRFFSSIKSLRRNNSGIAPLKENGRLHVDPGNGRHTKPPVRIDIDKRRQD